MNPVRWIMRAVVSVSERKTRNGHRVDALLVCGHVVDLKRSRWRTDTKVGRKLAKRFRCYECTDYFHEFMSGDCAAIVRRLDSPDFSLKVKNNDKRLSFIGSGLPHARR